MFVSGVLFLLLTLAGARRYIIAAIPVELRLAIAAGIGLFITFAGARSLGLVVDNEATLVGLGSFSRPVFLGLTGLMAIVLLEVRKVRGAILIGIVLTTVLGAVLGEVSLPGRVVSSPPSIAPLLLQMDIIAALKWGMWGAIFSFMFVDLFDSVGTIVACSYEAGMVRDDGTIEGIDRVLEADAVATVVGAALGTSTTTSYIESGAGIAEGGRTGLCNLVTGVLFLAALFFTPVIGVVPAFATAPALIIVGVYMFRNVAEIDFRDMAIGVPAFLTIILMPLTNSISTGLAFGFIATVAAAIGAGRARRLHPAMWLIAAMSVVDLAL